MASGPHARSSWISRNPSRVIDLLRSLVLVLSGIVVVAVWGWLRNADSRALASMDPDLRRDLFQRSRAEAEVLCTRPELAEECRTRLEFLERFPECDASCRNLVVRRLHRPSR